MFSLKKYKKKLCFCVIKVANQAQHGLVPHVLVHLAGKRTEIAVI